MVQFDEWLVVVSAQLEKRMGRGEECKERTKGKERGKGKGRVALPLPRYSPAQGEVSYQPWTKTHLSVRRGSPYGA